MWEADKRQGGRERRCSTGRLQSCLPGAQGSASTLQTVGANECSQGV